MRREQKPLSINDLVMWEKRLGSLSGGAKTAGSFLIGGNMLLQIRSSGELKLLSASYIPGCVAFGIAFALSNVECRLEEARKERISRLLERPVERS